MDLRFKGLVALVTGGGTGIGRATANLLAHEGASVVVTGRRPEFIQEVAEEITIEGGKALSIAGDISKSADAARMIENTARAFGRLDILVNNAGVFRGGPIEEISDDAIQLLIEVNLLGMINITRVAIPELKKYRGCIINVSSVLTRQGNRGFPCAVYAASKGGVESFTRSLAVELACHEVRVNAVCPAVVETPIYETIMPREAVPHALEQMQDIHPLARNGRPEEIAAAIAFLASPVSAWTTGCIMQVDGGRSCE
jgi:NAD(P)-dependent dehydrogenase (short-subunit alcohol dehydrogenase family)